MALECTTLLAVQLQDDQDRRDGLDYMIEQQGEDDVDVLHVFDHRGVFIGRWVQSQLLSREEQQGCKANPDTWHIFNGFTWGWISV